MPDQNSPSSHDPYAAPQPENSAPGRLPDLGEAAAELPAVDVSRKQEHWTVSLYPDRIRFMRTGVAVHDVTRDELFETAILRVSGFLPRTLMLKLGKKQKGLQFTAEDFEVLREWVNPFTTNDLKIQLKRRFAYVLPVAIVFIVLALPLPGDPVAGEPAIPFDIVGLILGSTLAIVVMISKFWPHRIFFLLDSIWFLALAVSIVYDVITTGDSWFWLFFVIIQVQVTINGVRLYQQFADVSPYEPRSQSESFQRL